mmetsp:Transcript_45104/g.118280  ORF Transcript_45104/g.118280 Transcript_45104/m.118280 type:complete len:328 (-) Transcript_45104:369-1352(-)
MPPKKKEQEYIVEDLVDFKLEGKKKLFLVKWKGFAAKQNTWEPAAHLKGLEDEMAEAEAAKAPKAPKKRKEEPVQESPAKKMKGAKKPIVDVVKLAELLKTEVMKMSSKAAHKKDKEEKDKAEKKESTKKKQSEVVEVDKILAVKANAKGILVYQILWMDGSKTWEPEDNVMDDDLVDEFEAEEQAKAYSGDDIKVGSNVEVKNVVDGFENSWSEATVTKKTGSKFTVEFGGFVNDEGEAETESGIKRDRLRLVPEGAPKGWVPIVGEIIEVNEDDCWWEARVIEINGKKAKLQLRVSDEYKTSTIGTKKLRPCSWLTMAGKRAGNN